MCRLLSPPVQAMPLAAQKADLGHEYEEVSVALQPSRRPTGDFVQNSEATLPIEKPTASDGDYDVVKPCGPNGWATMSDDVQQCSVSAGASAPGGATTNVDDYNITKCPAYAPVMCPESTGAAAPMGGVATNDEDTKCPAYEPVMCQGQDQ